ncbi:hypothetical protein EC973_008083 [Apophysomyces ossiformis]|uniref:SH3 domain-containing protein n=1 Tax=Apophysomyces ossiformis TaxID=679940 RepID=A0A8H7BTV7_9FUNG|nr:hypothetical protein EC973_008083 [Apophysomyces ossiformis]
MSKPLVINTQLDRSHVASQWQASPRAGTIRDEDSTTLLKKRAATDTICEEDEEEVEDEEEEEEEEDDDDEDEEDNDDDSSTFTSSPSIPDENIDFDLCYTLHTFVATVDGQASVVKGDAMTLLDDSNSYWWLVKVLKTSEIGYIPAENIETPFERLARLNKHRNVEMTATAIPSIDTPPTKKHKKKVTLSKELKMQSQIILTGKDDDDELEETYEEWEEEMDDEDVGVDDTNQRSMDMHERASPQESQGCSTTDDSDTVAAAPAPSCQSPPITSPKPSEKEDKKSTQAIAADTLRRFFSRSKKDKVEPPKKATPITPDESDVGSSLSGSSTLSAEESPKRERTRSVIRVYAGNINVGATYNSVLVDENTNAEHLLMLAMERFHISQIEGKAARRLSTSGIEYYLTVKPMDGDEITLAPQDKPLEMFNSLTTHLTTPMPSLTHIKQLSQPFSTGDFSKVSKARQRAKARFGEDTAIRFYLHKRIKRVNERDGQIYVKVSLYADPPAEKMNAVNRSFSTRSLRRKKLQYAAQERIDKIMAISPNSVVSDLTAIALEKFHVPHDTRREDYRLMLSINGKEKLLLPGGKLAEILHDDTQPTGSNEKSFILRKSISASRSKDQSSSSSSSLFLPNSSKVAPATLPSSPPSNRPIPVPYLDADTESVLKRLDNALLALERERGVTRQPAQPSMAVARNAEQGIDIILPHGVLRSKVCNNEAQYSLMTPGQGTVMQKVVQPAPTETRQIDSISDVDIASLVRYGATFLETREKSPLFFDPQSSLSNMDDLEKVS